MARRGGATTARSMTLRGHLLELRNRFFLIAVVLVVTSTVAYVFRDTIIALLLDPLDGRQLQYLTPGGGFTFIFSVIFYAGLAAAIPVLIHQAYAFFSPVLSDKVRRRGGWLLFWSPMLLVAGVLFGYIYAVPGALNFLYGFADEYVVSALTAESYLDFVVKYTLGLGLMFQIPLIMMIIHWIKPQKPMKLLKFERWVVLLSFVIAAIITPTPDPVNQTIVAVPIILVYQIGFIAILLNIRRGKKIERRNQKAALAAKKAAEKLRETAPLPAPEPEIQPKPLPQPAPVKVPQPKPVAPARSAAVPTPARRAGPAMDGFVQRGASQRRSAPQPRHYQEDVLFSARSLQPARRPAYIDGVAPRMIPSR